MFDIIIRNGTIIDGSGAVMFRADVGIKGDRIIDIGDLSSESATEYIDATDQYVAPGFIDINNHSDVYWQIFANPHLESLLYQGITTIIGGNCGSSLAPVVNRNPLQSIQKWTDIRKANINWSSMREFLQEVGRHKLTVNFATLVGHSTIRRGLVEDEPRSLMENEMHSLLKIIKQSLQEGACGCSVGLEYTHARHAAQSELIGVGMLIKEHKGIYTFHLRDDAENLLESVAEIIDIAKKSGANVHISHLKASGEESWFLMQKALELIEDAQRNGINISFDIYPYTFTASVLYTLLPVWVTEGGKKVMIERLKDFGIRHEVMVELKEKKINYDNAVLLSSPLNQMLVYQNISEIAKNQSKSPEEVVLDILIASNGQAIASLEVVSEENIIRALRSASSMISTSGSGYSSEHGEETGEKAHPRSFGTFPLILSHYVREKKVLSWEDAIHKMSGKPAEKFGVVDRGVLQKGKYADIVVFHPEKINSPATSTDPHKYSSGMNWVLVNGKITIGGGEYGKQRFGTILSKKQPKRFFGIW